MGQPEEAAGGEKVSRRSVLRYIGLAAVGAAAVFAVESAASEAPSANSGGDPAPSSQASPAAQGASTITVQVNYFLMPAVGATQDDFVLPSPAKYNDLLSQILTRHPLLTAMMPTMVVLVDGSPPQSGTALKDGDEVDFVPIMAGG